MSPHDHDAEQTTLGAMLRVVLGQFEGRSLDDALIAEMTRTLNQELASLLDDRRIEVVRDDSGIRAEVSPESAAEQVRSLPGGVSANFGEAAYDAVTTAVTA